MPLIEDYYCQRCLYWKGDREGDEHAEGVCIRYPNGQGMKVTLQQTGPAPPTGYEGSVELIKKATDTCAEWKNWLIPHGGVVPGTPEYP